MLVNDTKSIGCPCWAPKSRNLQSLNQSRLDLFWRNKSRRQPQNTTSSSHSKCIILAQAARVITGTDPTPERVKRKSYQVFDEAVITVRSGSGGNGEIVDKGKGRTVRNFKYSPGGNSPKQIWLRAAEPADGADGSSVLLFVDPALDSLLHLHGRKKYAAPNGGNGDPVKGSGGPLSRTGRFQQQTPPFKIGVPPGTVVKRKKGGQQLGELLNIGDHLVVAEGGRGGLGVKRPSREDSAPAKKKVFQEGVIEESIVEDDNWKVDSFGQPGLEVSLSLILRVVADVGLVGLPNAGKSSLLAALTRASPEVAPYPFTTLTPNLGVIQGSPQAPAADDEDDFGVMANPRRRRTVLADLPGLIEGAHMGRGLGRMFLRHLRRTRAILHVVDGAATDPPADYRAVREELRMYNPEYCARPHIVAVNKMDLEDASELRQELIDGIALVARQMQEENEGVPSLPSHIVCVSALEKTGLEDIQEALRELLHEEEDDVIPEEPEESYAAQADYGEVEREVDGRGIDKTKLPDIDW